MDCEILDQYKGLTICQMDETNFVSFVFAVFLCYASGKQPHLWMSANSFMQIYEIALIYNQPR